MLPTERRTLVLEGNEAAARVAYLASEVIAIYPITPSSLMGELCDAWSAAGEPNAYGSVPSVIEMQSEGGAAGAVHGALQAGSLTTTFTSSQGLLLMIPDMYKIAGELTPAVFHIAARAIATHALSIFGDHSDAMSVRATGWAMLFGSSVQEAADLALLCHAATLKTRIPFLHVFDGFRTSHEVSKAEVPGADDVRALLDMDAILAHRERALSPERPVIRGTAQNPDVFFQGKEAANRWYDAVPESVQALFDDWAERTGRRYRLYDYVGAPDAERVVVVMGSGSETVRLTVEALVARGESVGMVQVRLYRPFAVKAFLRALPTTTRVVAVLDRCREPGAPGEPLFLDVVAALSEGATLGLGGPEALPRTIGGRYGLGSKEFTPGMVKALFDEMAQLAPKPRFTLGIEDDVSRLSIDEDPDFTLEPATETRAVFWGLGSDGTVSSVKNTLHILGEDAGLHVQGYFVYDSKKSGSVTASHVRFGPHPIQRPWLVKAADVVSVSQFFLLKREEVLASAAPGATLLVNSPHGVDGTWAALSPAARRTLLEKGLKLWIVDASAVAAAAGLKNRVNTVMQACYFGLTGALPHDVAIERIKASIQKTWGRKNPEAARKNLAAVDLALAGLQEIPLGPGDDEAVGPRPRGSTFVERVTAALIAGHGDQLPVSALPPDGTWPVGTAKLEKRDFALEVPAWDEELCIQCGKCVVVCPHAAIRAKAVANGAMADAPAGLVGVPAKWKELPDTQFVLTVSNADCTGCQLCHQVCPVIDKQHAGHKALDMVARPVDRTGEAERWQFFLDLPEIEKTGPLPFNTVKNLQLLPPLFEFSGACSGCGETPYLKIVSQLFGDRAIVANATGCSSIYGGNLPTTPWTTDRDGRGPAWANSLFEDNAEFGLGIRLAVDQQAERARHLVQRHAELLGDTLVAALLAEPKTDAASVAALRARIAEARAKLGGLSTPEARDLRSLLDGLVPRSVWIVGGDGWAYDIDYGGLDHVLASGRNVNLMVLDTGVYSNTGGQASKATPFGAIARFAANGKPSGRKDMGAMAMAYGNVYVAQIALGARDAQTLKAITEAEAWPGPSLILAYSHCIAHGIDIADGLTQQELAVKTGAWPLYRFHPGLKAQGKNPLQLDSQKPVVPYAEYAKSETRFRLLFGDGEEAEKRLHHAQQEVLERWARLERMAQG